MTDRALGIVLSAAVDWQLRGDLLGTTAVMCCGAKALEHERKGERWNAFTVCQEYAVEKDKVQHSVWVCICYALARGEGPATPDEAIDEIIRRGYRNGYITRDKA